jgi:hypothetical protein
VNLSTSIIFYLIYNCNEKISIYFWTFGKLIGNVISNAISQPK